MPKLKYPALLTASILAITSSAALSQTQMRLTIDGVFSWNTGNGHPDINFGDTFSFSIEFIDTESISWGLSLRNFASLGSSFTVNGAPHAFNPPTVILFGADTPPTRGSHSFPAIPGKVGELTMASGENTLNGIFMDFSPLAGTYPSIVGPTVEISDFPYFANLDLSATDFFIQGTRPFYDAIHGHATSSSIVTIPEPDCALLAGIAALGLLYRRTSRGKIEDAP